MQQHPVPQNVTQYQFRLVGDMTLKQFLELLGGIVVAYLFYSSNLYSIFKWPLALSSILLGFGLAFFPIEDRPLDQWIVNFIKSIYAPTRYIWKKTNKIPHIFTFTAHPIIERVTATKTVKAPTIADLQPGKDSDISDDERQRLNVLDAMLARSASQNPSAASPAIPTPVVTDKPSVTVHKLKPISQIGGSTIFQASARPKPVIQPTQVILDSKTIEVPKTESQTIPTPTAAPAADPTRPSQPVFVAKPTVTTNATTSTATPVNIHLPAAPSSPNLVVGMVVTKDSKIVENAIVQIVTTDGIPARAMKTNSLGQFYISTPLSKGVYNLEVEKEGFIFPVNKLVIEDKIVPPLLLRSS